VSAARAMVRRSRRRGANEGWGVAMEEERRAVVGHGESPRSRPRLKAGVQPWRRRAERACNLRLAVCGVGDFFLKDYQIFKNTWTT
jgi:hypothetical protein